MAKTKSRGYTKKRSLKKRNTRRIRKSRSITRKSMNLYYGGEDDKIAEFKTKLKKFKHTLGTKMVKNSILKQHGLAYKYLQMEDIYNKLSTELKEAGDIWGEDKVNAMYEKFIDSKSVENFVKTYTKKYWDFDNNYDVMLTEDEYMNYVKIRDQQHVQYLQSIDGNVSERSPAFRRFVTYTLATDSQEE